MLTMAEKVALLHFFLVGLVRNEWIEITKVAGNKGEDILSDVAYTPATLENVIKKPFEAYKPPQNLNESMEERITEEDEYENNEEEERSSDIISLIKHIQHQLLSFKGKSLKAKKEHLEHLQDNILYEMKHHIKQLLQPPSTKTESRLYKEYFEDFRMDYPSNESALMTIGFLTFAVFVIKLVLKFIYIWKLKKQQIAYQTTTTTPASIFLKKNEREGIDQEQSIRILQYLDEYSPKR